MKTIHSTLVFVFWLLALQSQVALEAKGKIPSWLSQAKESANAYHRFDDDTQAIVLHSSSRKTYKGRGQIETHVREAIHLKTRDYRERFQAAIHLANDSQRIVDFDAWIIYPSGKIETFRKKDLIMVAASQDTLFSEAQIMILDRSYSARDDTIFAYEYTLSEKSVFLQTGWNFQDVLPTVYSEFSVELPKDWTIESYSMNDEAESMVFDANGTRFKWTCENLAGVKQEPARPPATQLYASIGLTLVPSEKDLKYEKSGIFDSWYDVAVYGDYVQQDQVAPNDAIRAKAKELVAGKTTQWEKVKAICEYTQSLNYVAVEMDLNSGGGYKPHKASQVFERHYGDCKDMTVLTRSLLDCIGIKSYATLANVGAEEYVHDTWPSPHQFNHCIVSIPLEEKRAGLAIVEDPTQGTTLIFDPTQKYTPVGDLPGSLQGTKILISHRKTNSLIHLPLAEADQDTLKREIEVEITQTGALKGTIVETSQGSIAEYIRRIYRTMNKEDFQEFIKGWIAHGTREARIENIETSDDYETNTFTLTTKFSAERYARAIGNKRLSIPPVFLGRRTWVPPEDEPRQTNYMTLAWSLDESSTIKFPEGYVFEAAPKPFSKEATWGSYSLKSEDAGKVIQVKRQLSSENEIIHVDRYEEVVDYYEKISRADSRPVVLKWEPGS